MTTIHARQIQLTKMRIRKTRKVLYIFCNILSHHIAQILYPSPSILITLPPIYTLPITSRFHPFPTLQTPSLSPIFEAHYFGILRLSRFLPTCTVHLNSDLGKLFEWIVGWDNSVGLASRYGLDGPGIESRWGARFSAPVQTSPGAHPASYTMDTGSFPGVKRPGRDVDNPSPSSAEVKERVEVYLY